MTDETKKVLDDIEAIRLSLAALKENRLWARARNNEEILKGEPVSAVVQRNEAELREYLTFRDAYRRELKGLKTLLRDLEDEVREP